MAYTAIIHIMNEDPVVVEIDELPTVNDTLLIGKNPRRRDGKDVHYVEPDVTTVIWPWTRVNFLEIMPSHDDDHIIGFVRD